MANKSILKNYLVMAVMLFGFGCATAAGDVIYVDDDGPADFDNIQAAIYDANVGDEIIVADGIYTGEGNRDIDFLGKAITVRSSDPTDPTIVASTIVDCGLNWSQLSTIRGFVFHSGEGSNSILSGLTIQDGHVLKWGDGGAGVHCSNSSPTISYCIIKDCRLNEFNLGGVGICCTDNSNPKIIRCTFKDNSALGMVGGGGIYCRSGSNATITACTIENNSAYLGGGIYIRDSSSTIKSCLITENHVVNDGGGIYILDSDVSVGHSTIVENSSDDTGAGLNSNSSSTIIDHCIIWGNTASMPPVNLEVHGPNPSVTFSDVGGGFGGIGNFDADPLLIDVSNDDYHLSPNSPCINTGDPNYVLDPNITDIDGQPRIINGRVDIGADEVNFIGPVIGLSALEFEFMAREGEGNPDAQVLIIENIGTGTMDWSIEEDCSWLEANPENGICNGDINEVNIIVDISGIGWGRYDCLLEVNSNTAINSGKEFNVTLHIYTDYEGGLHVPKEYPTIQAAIDDASNGDVVVVGDGIYTGPGNQDIDFLGKAIIVRSENGAANCIINVNASGSDPHRAFYLHSYEDANSIICGFTIHSGCASDSAWGGGGILCDSASPTIRDCIFYRNKALLGGGALCYIYASSPTIINCTFSDNEVQLGLGGAVRGAALPGVDEAMMNSCIVWGNEPSGDPGIDIQIAPHSKGGYVPINVYFSVLQSDWQSNPYIHGYDSIVADPCFFEAGADDYHLHWNSPCIDAGDPNYLFGPNDIDMDGDSRVMNGRIDMGADEFNPDTPIIKLSPSNLVFTAPMDGPNPEEQILSIYNIGGGTLNWQIESDCNWLDAYPTNGSSTGEVDDVNISVDITGLSAGEYNCDLIVSDPNAMNNSQAVSVTLDVQSPVIELSAVEFQFRYDEGGANPQDQMLTIRNAGVKTLNWTISYDCNDCNWLYVDPNTGSSTGEPNEVTLSVDVTGLEMGVYECELTVSDPNAENSPQIVHVTLSPECFPDTHDDYEQWLKAGKPDCWCSEIQCYGDVDGVQVVTKSGRWYVEYEELNCLADGWQRPDGQDGVVYTWEQWRCADFDHEEEVTKAGTWRVSYEDLNIISWNWQDDNAPYHATRAPLSRQDCLTRGY